MRAQEPRTTTLASTELLYVENEAVVEFKELTSAVDLSDQLPGQRLTGRFLLVPHAFLCLFLFSVPQVFVLITSCS